MYDLATQQWSCCSWVNATLRECSKPTNETWSAPAPQDLQQLESFPLGWSASLSSTTPQATSTSTDIPLQSSSSTNEEGLSVGAKIGLGFGISVGVLLVMTLIILAMILRQQRDRQKAADAYTEDSHQTLTITRVHESSQGNAQESTPAHQVSEVHSTSRYYELDPSTKFVELGTQK